MHWPSGRRFGITQGVRWILRGVRTVIRWIIVVAQFRCTNTCSNVADRCLCCCRSISSVVVNHRQIIRWASRQQQLRRPGGLLLTLSPLTSEPPMTACRRRLRSASTITRVILRLPSWRRQAPRKWTRATERHLTYGRGATRDGGRCRQARTAAVEGSSTSRTCSRCRRPWRWPPDVDAPNLPWTPEWSERIIPALAVDRRAGACSLTR